MNLKSQGGIALIKRLIPRVDIVIESYRPGVLEKLGLDPDSVLREINGRLIVARMTGFRRDGKYKEMAGHDINYIAVSGVLSLLGRRGEKPLAPGNLLGDFAGGGAVCFMGILLALIEREKNGKGQIVYVLRTLHCLYLLFFELRTMSWEPSTLETFSTGPR